MDAILYDSWCGEPLQFGYYENGKPIITDSLTREKAIEKYGPITNEEFGPKGGWKSVTFGTTKFISKLMKA